MIISRPFYALKYRPSFHKKWINIFHQREIRCYLPPWWVLMTVTWSCWWNHLCCGLSYLRNKKIFIDNNWTSRFFTFEILYITSSWPKIVRSYNFRNIICRIELEWNEWQHIHVTIWFDESSYLRVMIYRNAIISQILLDVRLCDDVICVLNLVTYSSLFSFWLKSLTNLMYVNDQVQYYYQVQYY